jgi:cytochrome c553
MLAPESLRDETAMKAVRALAAALLLAASTVAMAQDAARAEEIVMGKCFVCHGVDGESSSPLFPRLAGQHARYIERQLADYKSGRRASSTMKPMVEDLTQADFKALGAYFEARKPQPHPVADPELAKAGQSLFERGNPNSGMAACASCHGANGAGTATLPRLAGQHALYTENQLKAFNKRERTNDNAVMQSIAGKLSALEMKAVAVYISGLE